MRRFPWTRDRTHLLDSGPFGIKTTCRRRTSRNLGISAPRRQLRQRPVNLVHPVILDLGRLCLRSFGLFALRLCRRRSNTWRTGRRVEGHRGRRRIVGGFRSLLLFLSVRALCLAGSNTFSSTCEHEQGQRTFVGAAIVLSSSSSSWSSGSSPSPSCRVPKLVQRSQRTHLGALTAANPPLGCATTSSSSSSVMSFWVGRVDVEACRERSSSSSSASSRCWRLLSRPIASSAV